MVAIGSAARVEALSLLTPVLVFAIVLDRVEDRNGSGLPLKHLAFRSSSRVFIVQLL